MLQLPLLVSHFLLHFETLQDIHKYTDMFLVALRPSVAHSPTRSLRRASRDHNALRQAERNVRF